MTAPRRGQGRRPPIAKLAAWACGVAAAGLVVLVVVLLAGGGAPEPAPPGLTSAGPVTGWGLPVSRLAADVSAVATVGFLLAAAALLRGPVEPGHSRDTVAARASRRAAGVAVVWALAAITAAGFTVSSVLGRPVTDITAELGGYATSLPHARALVVQALAATAVAAFAGLVRTRRGSLALLCVAGAGLVPPLLSGHAATADLYGLAVASLLVHVWAAAVWVGGLGALTWVRTVSPPSVTPAALTRYSTIAGGCIALVAASGILNALTHLPHPAALVTAYGLLVLAKAAALGMLAGFGRWHRRRTIPAASRQGEWRGFARLAAVELLVMAATIALAVGLSRTPLPADSHAAIARAGTATGTVTVSLAGQPTPGHG